MDAGDEYIAFARSADQGSGVEIRVNFGLFAGREATPAELDELARRLLHDVERVTVVSERRYEVSERVEASVHQVRIEIACELVPDDIVDAARLEGRLLTLSEAWATACIAERHAPV